MISVFLAYAAAPLFRAGATVRPGAHVVVEVRPAAVRSAAPVSRPLRLAETLTGPLSDGVPHRAPSLYRAEAERGFSEGTFFLPGQIVDRRA
jgi:hypothetical protein